MCHTVSSQDTHRWKWGVPKSRSFVTSLMWNYWRISVQNRPDTRPLSSRLSLSLTNGEWCEEMSSLLLYHCKSPDSDCKWTKNINWQMEQFSGFERYDYALTFLESGEIVKNDVSRWITEEKALRVTVYQCIDKLLLCIGTGSQYGCTSVKSRCKKKNFSFCTYVMQTCNLVECQRKTDIWSN